MSHNGHASATLNGDGVLHPEDQIRVYLEEHGGHVEVPFHNLLTSWELDRQSTPAERERIIASLARAGIDSDRPLLDVDADDEITLSLEAPTDEPPVWLIRQPVQPAPMPQVQYAPAPPEVLPPTQGTGRDWKARSLLAAGLVVLVAGASAGAFFIGQGSRMSDGQVHTKLVNQVRHDHAVAAVDKQDALSAQHHRIVHKTNKQRRRAVRQARQDGTNTGFANGHAQGQAAGYSSGHSDGTAEGQVQGEAQGYTEGLLDGNIFAGD